MTWRPRRLAALAWVSLALLLLGLGMAVLLWLGWRQVALPDAPAQALTPALVARGAYVARAANCVGCHSAPGRPLMAGGMPLVTPFGTITPGNLTPDPETGLGRWGEADFRRALHQGVSRDGRLLYPAFPYPHFSAMRPTDVQALWAWLRSLTPVLSPAPAPQAQLSWPANQRWALALWRGWHFRPATPAPAARSAVDRGAYLATALGHCGACHSARNVLGGPRDANRWDGELMPGVPWWAPSLHRADEAGVQGWPQAELQAWLRTGEGPRGLAAGPMAEVVQQSTQHLSPDDLTDLAAWLQALPVLPRRAVAAAVVPNSVVADGRTLYGQHCADCHGLQGQGEPGRYPALSGNRLIAMHPPHNLLRALIEGGFGPGTAARPRPFGMPPFGALLGDAELAAIASYLRATWAPAGTPGVDAAQVSRARNPG